MAVYEASGTVVEDDMLGEVMIRYIRGNSTKQLV
jgi:hypothetical protein